MGVNTIYRIAELNARIVKLRNQLKESERKREKLKAKLAEVEQQKDEWATLFTDANHRLKVAEARIAALHPE